MRSLNKRACRRPRQLSLNVRPLCARTVRMRPQNLRIRAEQLAYWYLRLNGFLTIPNFIVHPEQGRNQETDVDLLAVRFPYRAELRTMEDDEVFTRVREKSFIAFAEVK